MNEHKSQHFISVRDLQYMTLQGDIHPGPHGACIGYASVPHSPTARNMTNAGTFYPSH